VAGDRIPVTVVIPVRNEERNLPRCLAALARFAEIIVVDSGSTDRTEEVARDGGAKVLHFAWNGAYPKKRNWVLLNHTLENPWVLFLDADEFVTSEFCEALQTAIEQTSHVGFWLNYTNYFMGQQLRHGVPQRKLALFRVGSGLYERIEEASWSSLDMEIHEHPVLEGTIGELVAPIEHNDDRGILKFIDRHRDYAMWEAQRYQLLVNGGDNAWAHLTKRQRTKYKNITCWWYPLGYGIYQYILKAGFLDGQVGLQYAFYKVWYFNTIRLLIRDATRPSLPNHRH
jgi:glycosyltransferase involved in cell wall biosynthesis